MGISTDPEGLDQAVAVTTLGPQGRLDGVLDHTAHVVQWSQEPMGPQVGSLDVSLQEHAQGPREHLGVCKNKHPGEAEEKEEEDEVEEKKGEEVREEEGKEWMNTVINFFLQDVKMPISTSSIYFF